MKHYDKIQALQLSEVFNLYIEYNGLTIAYAARCTGIPYTNLAEWAKGFRGISQRNADKVRTFLKGDFLIDVNTIITHILMEKEVENSDLTNE